ncbi:MAG: sigma-70 family RNA polymerase sigma factor [Planctomycetes bacterium]|nr:sigma-70 family RNA polymerase sigma factor [Planctomycetota bacterium]
MFQLDAKTPEEVLLESCRDIQSDAFDEAFAELYRRYRDRVYSIAYRMMGNAVDAMDVVQDAFRVLFLKLGSFRSDSRFSTWLFRIVVNCSIDLQRREAARSHRPTTSLASLQTRLEPTTSDGDPFEAASSSELGEHVHRALARLSPKLRAVLVLRYLEGMSYEQLAETLDVQLGTVKSRLARAHLALEQILSGSLEAFGYPAGRAGEAPEFGDTGSQDDAGDRHAGDQNAGDQSAGDQHPAQLPRDAEDRSGTEPGRPAAVRRKGGVA